jgi:hypothetical protein
MRRIWWTLLNKEGIIMNVQELILLLLFAAACFVSYKFGYKMADTKWSDEYQEQIEELISVRLNEVKALYDETYRNVFRQVFALYQEEKKKVEKEQEEI